MKRLTIIAFLCVAAALPAMAQGQAAAADQGTPESSLQPQVVIQTSLGDMVVELDAEKAPLTVLNFLEYVQSGFYKGTIFHRVVKGKMIHGGGYTPDLKLKEDGLREPVRYEGDTGLLHDPGAIAMYRRFDNLESGQAQFFINTAVNSDLLRLKDGSTYVVFGKVLEGMDVLEKIENVPVGTHPALAAGLLPYVPKEAVLIKEIRVRKPVDRARAERLAEQRAEIEADPVGYRVQLLENEFNAKAQITRSGLRFIECTPGTGAFPLAQDTVEFHYVGSLANGQEFDSSRSRTEEGPLKSRVETMIPGLREGIQKMREGGRMIFIIPPELGFGNEGYVGRIPPGATVFFDVTLENVTHTP